jgi:L-ascorbate metabolism protein UlaG (beta-lactamase superfamily)
MIQPLQSHDQLLADIHRAPDSDAFHMWWLGQSGFLLKWRGQHWLLDPYLSDSLTRKYADTDKPHVRMTELVVQPRRLDFIDLVTSSHNHTDHLDGETLRPLLDVNPRMTVVVPAANRTFAAGRLEVPEERLQPIDDGQTLRVGELEIHAVPAAHETIERDDQGRCRCLGYVLRFGDWTVYHSGDTIRYGAMAERLAPWRVDVAVLPINGRAPERRVAGNLWGAEAARLAHDIQAKLVVPCHFEMFTFNTADPREFRETARRLGQPCRVLACGERFSSDCL